MRYALAAGASLVVLLAVRPTAVLASTDTYWETVNYNGQMEVKGTTKFNGVANTVWFSCKTIPGSWSPSHWNASKQLEMYVSAGVPEPAPAPARDMFGQPDPLEALPSSDIKGLDGKPLFGARETRVSNGDERVTLMTASGTVTLSRDDFALSDSRLPHPVDPNRLLTDGLFAGTKPFDPGYHDARIKVAGRIRDIVLNNPTLHVHFGDPAKPAYSFTSDLSVGRKLIADFDANCK